MSTGSIPDEDLLPQPRDGPSGPRSWGFVFRPFWLFSHVFALAVIVSFVALGLWQLQRLDDRKETNFIVETRALVEPMAIDAAMALPADERDFVAVSDRGRYLDGEVVRVANRSQGGAAGDWVIALFETDSGERLLVNRGFLRREAVTAPPTDGAIDGWARQTQLKESTFGAVDTGETERVPRLDVAAIAERLGLDEGELAPAWLQLAAPERAFAPDRQAADVPIDPEPVPLPTLDDGSHFSYAMQWFTFALLGGIVYVLILWRKAAER